MRSFGRCSARAAPPSISPASTSISVPPIPVGHNVDFTGEIRPIDNPVDPLLRIDADGGSDGNNASDFESPSGFKIPLSRPFGPGVPISQGDAVLGGDVTGQTLRGHVWLDSAMARRAGCRRNHSHAMAMGQWGTSPCSIRA
jgi:hypothetical protein